MKTPALATVYLDNAPIGLMGDPKPRVSKIVAAGGKRPEDLQVLRALSATDLRGKPVQLEDIIDRTAEPARPIYLTSKPTQFRSSDPEAPSDEGRSVEAPSIAVPGPLRGPAPTPEPPQPLSRPARKTPSSAPSEPEWDP